MTDRTPTLGEIAKRFDRAAIRRLLVDRCDGVGTDFASLLRIAVFAVAWLVVIGLVVRTPPPDTSALAVNAIDPTPDDVARSVTLDRRDERGFAPHAETGGLRIAWVGGSTIQEVADDGAFRFIPGIVSEEMQLADGASADVDIYFLEATRVVDLYAATLAAIAEKPDVLVVTLNPILVSNGAAVQTWDNLDGLLVRRAVTRPTALPVAAALASPSDVAWGLFAGAFEVVEDRWYWSNRLYDRPTVGSLLEPAMPDSSDVGELQRVADLSLPIDFWMAYGDIGGDGSRLGRQLALLEMADRYDDRVNRATLARLFEAIAGSDVPAVLYVPPVRTDVDAAPWLGSELARIEGGLDDLRSRLGEGPVSFSATPLPIDAGALDFVDLLHVRNGTPVADEIATRICELLASLDGPICVDGGGSS